MGPDPACANVLDRVEGTRAGAATRVDRHHARPHHTVKAFPELRLNHEKRVERAVRHPRI
jgi:hypothetical protein